jgi:class 3 adenylate cyclase
LSVLLNEHKKFVSGLVAKFEGSVIKGEGDSFWLVFPSVTAAALAAIEMHDNLRVMQAGQGEEKCLAIRVAIAVGDVLHQSNDIFGHAVNLLARIETVTPANEIYMSHAAWAVLNKAKVSTSYVDTYTLKGIQEPEKVYRVEQKYRTRTITNQVIVITNISGWASFMESHSVSEIEDVLIDQDDFITAACNENGGVVRNTSGGGYICSFSGTQNALAAVEKICQQWDRVIQRYKIGLTVAVHKGDINILRGYVYGTAINETELLRRRVPIVSPDIDKSGVLVTQEIAIDVRGTRWEQQLREVDWNKLKDGPLQEFFKAHNPRQFIAVDE